MTTDVFSGILVLGSLLRTVITGMRFWSASPPINQTRSRWVLNSARGRRSSGSGASGSVLLANDVVLLASSGGDLRRTLGRFAECEATGVRIRTSKSQKLQELGDSEFDDRSLSLQDLPSLKTDYFHWLHMQDSERLGGAVLGLKVFWHQLDLKRRQLEQERRGRRDRLTHLMQNVELDIRDLIYLTEKQLVQASGADSSLSNHEPSMGAPPLTPSFWARLAWHKRLEGYVVLRDLERYLRRLVRDFMLLTARRSD